MRQMQNSFRQSIQMQHHLQSAKNQSTIVKSVSEDPQPEPIAESLIEPIVEPQPEPIVEEVKPVVEEPKIEQPKPTNNRLPNIK